MIEIGMDQHKRFSMSWPIGSVAKRRRSARRCGAILMSAPGIGVLTAYLILHEIGSIETKRVGKPAASLGLT